MGLSTISATMKHIIQMPNLTSSATPQLTTHIAEAKVFAGNWLKTDAPVMASGITEATGLYNKWNGSTMPQLEIWSKNVTKNISQIKSTLTQAAHDANLVDKLVLQIGKQESSNVTSVATIVGNISQDATKITAKISADHTQINYLQGQIAKVQAKLRAAKTREAWERAIGIIFGLGDLVSLIDSLASNVHGLELQLSAYSRDGAQLEVDASHLSVVVKGVGNWYNAMKLLTNSIGSIGAGLDALSADIGAAVDEIDSTDPATLGVWMQAQLIAIKKDYDQVGHLATALSK